MTVKELMTALQSYPADFPVILAKDAEGNGFSPLPDHRGLSVEKYQAESSYSGSLDTSDDGSDVNAVVLWPTN